MPIHVGEFGTVFRRRIRARDEDGKVLALDLTGRTVTFRFTDPNDVSTDVVAAVEDPPTKGFARIVTGDLFDVAGTWRWAAHVEEDAGSWWTEEDSFEVAATLPDP